MFFCRDGVVNILPVFEFVCVFNEKTFFAVLENSCFMLFSHLNHVFSVVS